jgi:hypothetical protein
MLTKLTIHNFKRFQHVEIELGQHVVFIGPNNSGKTTALQALALWERWKTKWLDWFMTGGATSATLGRLDLVSLPVPPNELWWHDLRTSTSGLNTLPKRILG